MYDDIAPGLSAKLYPTMAAIGNVYEAAKRFDAAAADINPMELWDMHHVRRIDDSGFIDSLYSAQPIRDLQRKRRILNSRRSKPGKKRKSSPRSSRAAIRWATPAAASNVLEGADGAGAGMEEMTADGITEATKRAAWRDLREFLDISKQRGELVVVKGADPHLEMGALYELSLRKTYPPVLLFEEIKGYPRNYRVATNVRTSPLLVGNLDLEAVRELRRHRQRGLKHSIPPQGGEYRAGAEQYPARR